MNIARKFSIIMLLFAGFSIAFAQKSSYNLNMFEGNKLFDQKKYDAAAGKYVEAAKENQKDFGAHYNLGNALYKANKYEEAKAQYEKAQQLASTLPDKASALHNLGNTYMQLNQPEKAAEFYKQSLKQDPYNEHTRKNYEIAKLKEKENQQKQQQGKGGGNDQNKDQNQGDGQDKQQNQSQQGGGENQQNEGKGSDNQSSGQKNSGNLPKGTQDAILNRASEKERETAKRILNKNSYSMPESNEKDW